MIPRMKILQMLGKIKNAHNLYKICTFCVYLNQVRHRDPGIVMAVRCITDTTITTVVAQFMLLKSTTQYLYTYYA